MEKYAGKKYDLYEYNEISINPNKCSSDPEIFNHYWAYYQKNKYWIFDENYVDPDLEGKKPSISYRIKDYTNELDDILDELDQGRYIMYESTDIDGCEKMWFS